MLDRAADDLDCVTTGGGAGVGAGYERCEVEGSEDIA